MAPKILARRAITIKRYDAFPFSFVIKSLSEDLLKAAFPALHSRDDSTKEDSLSGRTLKGGALLAAR